MLGPYGLIFKKNLVKKLMAMNIMQVAVILFLVLGLKVGGTVPIELPGLTGAAHYINPLPRCLDVNCDCG